MKNFYSLPTRPNDNVSLIGSITFLLRTEQCRHTSRPGNDVPGTVSTQRRLVGCVAHRAVGPVVAVEGAEQDGRRLRGVDHAKRKPRRSQQQRQRRNQQQQLQQQQQQQQDGGETSRARESDDIVSDSDLVLYLKLLFCFFKDNSNSLKHC